MCCTLGFCGFLLGRYRERMKRTRTRAETRVVNTKAALLPTLRQTASAIGIPTSDPIPCCRYATDRPLGRLSIPIRPIRKLGISVWVIRHITKNSI